MGNRHGAKGVVAKIVPHDKMPQLPDGRHLDVCVNPLGIISRMNIGQLYELHLGMALICLREKAKQMLADKTNQRTIKKYILDFIQIIDKTETGWYYSQFKDQLPKRISEEFIESLCLIQPPFETIKMDDIRKAMKHANAEFEYELYDPISKSKILNTVAVGPMYFFRMVHIAQTKLAARGIGLYQRKTMQPLGGKKNKGGQRMGEMESACFIAQDAMINLNECLTTKSDCIDLKNHYIQQTIEGSIVDSEDTINKIPESVKLLDAYLKTIGVVKD